MKTTTIILVPVVLLLCASPDAAAWGCEGHRAVVYIAERLLPPQTIGAAQEILKASPVDATMRRFCDRIPDDPLADEALWADDYRSLDASTFGWHFVNVPRTVALTSANEHTFCPGGSCVVDALAAQYAEFATSRDAAARAKALRFVIHFVGDIAQPLHATTNGDRGGTCVPVTYYDRAPQESQTTPNDFAPNLHGVWDSNAIRTLMTKRRLADARALADYVAASRPLPNGVVKQAVSKPVALRWARDSHRAGSPVVYARLRGQVGFEPPSALTLSSCADNHDVVHRMLAKQIVIDDEYEQAAVPVILDQLRAAGIRLAAALKAAMPER